MQQLRRFTHLDDQLLSNGFHIYVCSTLESSLNIHFPLLFNKKKWENIYFILGF